MDLISNNNNHNDNNNRCNTTTQFIKQNLSFLRQQLNLYKQDIETLTQEIESIKSQLHIINLEIETKQTCVEHFRDNLNNLDRMTIKELVELRQTKASLEFELNQKNSALTAYQNAYESLNNKLKSELKRFSEMPTNVNPNSQDPNKLYFNQNPMLQKVVTELLVQKDSKTVAAFASTCKFWQKKLTKKTTEPHLSKRAKALNIAILELRDTLIHLEIEKNTARLNFDRQNCRKQNDINFQITELYKLEKCLTKLLDSQDIEKSQLTQMLGNKNHFSPKCWKMLCDEVFSFCLDIQNDNSAPKTYRFKNL